MEKRSVLTRILAIAGTILVWLPILAPVLFSLGVMLRARVFRFDYLMPAELFLFVLAGGGLLLWASLRARSRRSLIAWGLGLAAALLIGGQALAVVTGLASGETEPAGFSWALVVGSLVGYALAIIAMGLGGVLLLCDLFKAGRLAATSA